MYNEVASYIEMWEAIFKAMQELSKALQDQKTQKQYEEYFDSIGAHFGIVRDQEGNSLGEKFILKKMDNTTIYVDMDQRCAVALVDGQEVLHKALSDNTLNAIHRLDLGREINYMNLSAHSPEHEHKLNE